MRIAVVSDLHVHHESDVAAPESWLTCGASPDSWSNDPIASLGHLFASPEVRADVALFPGDFANRGSPRGMATAFAHVTTVSSWLHGALPICIPGNHDLQTSDVPGADLFAPLRPFMSRIPVPDAALSAELWREHFVIVHHEEASFLVLNTTGKAVSRATARRGVLDEAVLRALSDHLQASTLRRVRVAVLHHHPMQHSIPNIEDADVLQRGDDLLRLLTAYSFALVVHGHKHHPRLTYGPTGADAPAVLAAGSLSCIPKGALITITKNLFHLVDVDVGGVAGVPFAGVIRTWQFVHGDGWVPASRNSTKFPHVAGFGCRFATATVAEEIAKRVTRSVLWSDLVNDIQALEYVAPDDQMRILGRLESTHGIDVAFDERGDPHILTPLRRP